MSKATKILNTVNKGFEKIDTSIIWSYVKHVNVMNSKYHDFQRLVLL